MKEMFDSISMKKEPIDDQETWNIILLSLILQDKPCGNYAYWNHPFLCVTSANINIACVANMLWRG